MIELEAVTKRYGARTVVDRLSLQVGAGELLVLLGGSGSGKTTTLKMMNRLVDPSEGTIRVDGIDTRDVDPPTLRRRIGYVFQQIGLFPHLSVAENVGITPSLLGWPAARIRARVDELLELVELPPDEYRTRLPDQLSGGQQQRVGVARALAARPSMLLLDEPFGALDPITRQKLQASLIRIRSQLALTAVFVTHDVLEALALGDRIAVLRDGRLVQIGDPATLLDRPADDGVRDLLSAPQRQAELVESVRAGAPATGSS